MSRRLDEQTAHAGADGVIERMTHKETPGERLCRLLSPLHTAVRATARRLCQSPADGDDLLHEAVLRALARIDQLRDEARFRPWFYAVLLSVHRQRSRVAFWRRFVPFLPMRGSMQNRAHDDDRLPAEPSAGWLASGWPSTLDEETRTRAIRVSTALQRLPVEQREAIVLFEVEGFAIDEIAELQRASQSAVKSRLARARQRLREHYQAQCQTEDASERGADVDAKSHTPLWLPRRGAGS